MMNGSVAGGQGQGDGRSLELLNRLSSSRAARTNQRSMFGLLVGVGLFLVVILVIYLLVKGDVVSHFT
jgi:hypothetical protein